MGKQGRTNAGKSEKSYVKHHEIVRASGSMIAKYRHFHPNAQCVVVDGNAGDGIGVEAQQPDFFYPAKSESTAELSVRLASLHDCDVVLCEKDRKKRAVLFEKFGNMPRVHIFADNALAVPFLEGRRYDYALVICDPCGAAGLNPEYFLKKVVRIIPRADYVIILNIAYLKRLKGTEKGGTKAFATHRAQHLPMIIPRYWTDLLNKTRMAQTITPVYQTNGFVWVMIIVSDYLSDTVLRHPFKETQIDGNPEIVSLASASEKSTTISKSGSSRSDHGADQDDRHV